MRDLLGGKGAGVAEMTRAGLPVPPGFTITTEACNAFYAAWRKVPRGAVGAGREGAPRCREDDRQGVRRPAQSAAGQRPQRRQVLDAGNDGHGPQPRPQCEDARRPGRADQGPPFRPRRAPPIHPAVQQDRARDRRAAVRGRARRDQEAQEGEDRRGPQRSGARGADHRVPRHRQAPFAHRFPRGSDGAAARGDRCGVRVVEQQARDRLPQLQPHPARPRHRRQRPVDGVRQHGRRLRHRRRVHARSVDRRAEAVRRVPHQRAGRGRRRRHPHPQADRGDGDGSAEGVQAVRADRAQAREALPRRAGHGVHDRARHAVHAADAERQADRGGGGEDRRRHGARAAHHQARGGAARRAGAGRSAAASPHRSEGQGQRARNRARRLAGRGLRQGRLRRRPRRGAWPRRARR